MGQPVDLRFAYSALTNDIVTMYSLNRSFNHLDSPDFYPEWYFLLKNCAKMLPLIAQFPWLVKMQLLPGWVLSRVSPKMVPLFEFNKVRHVRLIQFAIADQIRQSRLRWRNFSTLKTARLHVTRILVLIELFSKHFKMAIYPLIKNASRGCAKRQAQSLEPQLNRPPVSCHSLRFTS